MKTKLVYKDNECRSIFGIKIHKWVHKTCKNNINYYECSKCGARKAEGPDYGNYSDAWLNGDVKMVKKTPKRRIK